MHTAALLLWYIYGLVGLTFLTMFLFVQSFRDPQYRPQRAFSANALGLTISMLYRAIHPTHSEWALYLSAASFLFFGVLKLVKRARRKRLA